MFSGIFAGALVVDSWVSAHAQTEITVVTPLPTKESFERILPGLEAKTGYKVNATYGTRVGSKQPTANDVPFVPRPLMSSTHVLATTAIMGLGGEP